MDSIESDLEIKNIDDKSTEDESLQKESEISDETEIEMETLDKKSNAKK